MSVIVTFVTLDLPWGAGVRYVTLLWLCVEFSVFILPALVLSGVGVYAGTKVLRRRQAEKLKWEV
jgi:hypothetical protein